MSVRQHLIVREVKPKYFFISHLIQSKFKAIIVPNKINWRRKKENYGKADLQPYQGLHLPKKSSIIFGEL